jgi:GrpB-like predicted nucleotidyltransferase (UPF0157 family)
MRFPSSIMNPPQSVPPSIQSLLSSHRPLLNRLAFHLSLFFQAPKKYLFSYTYPADKFVSLQPYSPTAQAVAQEVIAQLSQIHPPLSIHYVGSSALKILGNKDIDLLIECSPDRFSHYLPLFNNLSSSYSKRRPRFVEWRFNRRGYRIELLLIDPTHPDFTRQIKIFQLLQSRPDLLSQYADLKRQLNGKSLREYDQARIYFFNQLLQKSGT